MNAGSDFSGVLSLLVWATLLPLVIVLVMRSRHRQEEQKHEEAFFRNEDTPPAEAPPTADSGPDGTPPKA